MIRLHRPSPERVAAHLRRPDSEFSYGELGATAKSSLFRALSTKYDLDQRRFPLGRGRDLFERACSALFAWRHFEIPWLELQGATLEVLNDQVVATLTRVCGLWFLNPCRVVYKTAGLSASNEAAFAYGTLSGHLESGEERFSIQFNPSTEEVVYEIRAFSRPAVALSKLGYPWVRRLQKRFAISTAEALARACPQTSRCS